MIMQNHSRVKHKDKIQEALGLLNQVIHAKQDEIYQLVEDKYSSWKNSIASVAEAGKNSANHFKEQILDGIHTKEERIFEKAKEVEKRIQKNPWKAVGAVAATTWLLGYLMGRRK